MKIVAEPYACMFRVRCRQFIPLLAIGFLPTLVCAGQFEVKSYLLVGKAECVGVENVSYPPKGNVLPFFVAITPERVLTGWKIQNPESCDIFYYSSDSDDWPVTFEIASSPGSNMLQSGSRHLRVIVRQKKLKENIWSARIASAQVAAFDNFSFATFFYEGNFGIRFDDVAALLAQGKKRVSAQFSCGKLTVVNRNGLQAIEFLQQANDVFISIDPTMKLRDIKYDPFDSGLQRVLKKCVFEPPLTAESKAPWVTECVNETEGRNGKMVRVRTKIDIEEYSTDTVRINREIDKVLSVVPEGSPVVTNSPVDYIWKGGRVERKFDVAALENSEALHFQRSRSRMFFWTLAALILLITVFIVRVWRRIHH